MAEGTTAKDCVMEQTMVAGTEESWRRASEAKSIGVSHNGVVNSDFVDFCALCLALPSCILFL